MLHFIGIADSFFYSRTFSVSLRLVVYVTSSLQLCETSNVRFQLNCNSLLVLQ